MQDKNVDDEEDFFDQNSSISNYSQNKQSKLHIPMTGENDESKSFMLDGDGTTG